MYHAFKKRVFSLAIFMPAIMAYKKDSKLFDMFYINYLLYTKKIQIK